MKVLTVAIKAIKLSDQCINSAAFEKPVHMKAYNKVHSMPINGRFLIASSESFLPQKVLVQIARMEKQFIKN